MDKTCSFLKESLAAVFANELEVMTVESGCIVTLPLKTIDDRYIDVFVEQMPGSKNFIYVHDGGKNTAELSAQGIHPTDTQTTLFKGIATAHGAIFQSGRFQILCKNEAEVERAVVAIGQCAALSMVEFASHIPNIEDEPLTSRVARALQQWQPNSVEIRRRHFVRGKTGVEHLFDFVAMPAKSAVRHVALKLLPPSVGPSWQVSRYGFLVLDIEAQEAAKWSRLAIVSKAEEWPQKAIDIVRDLSRDVILLESDHEEQIERILPHKMNELTEAA
jgi:hypothetical protein